jgi:uncharacterized protein (DUF1501 family)
MQSSAPELMDLSGETQGTLDAYGVDPSKPSFARNCLLARRLVEKGVRFVQLYHTDWDHHGNVDTHLGEPLDQRCGETDKPAAALVRDLKQRGLLGETLIIWSGEFGRTPQGEPRDLIGRDHNPYGFLQWMAGAGIKGGVSYGETDDIGHKAAVDPVSVHDLHATLLYLLGIDHERLTYLHNGREHRLTDVAGEVVEKLIA